MFLPKNKDLIKGAKNLEKLAVYLWAEDGAHCTSEDLPPACPSGWDPAPYTSLPDALLGVAVFDQLTRNAHRLYWRKLYSAMVLTALFIVTLYFPDACAIVYTYAIAPWLSLQWRYYIETSFDSWISATIEVALILYELRVLWRTFVRLHYMSRDYDRVGSVLKYTLRVYRGFLLRRRPGDNADAEGRCLMFDELKRLCQQHRVSQLIEYFADYLDTENCYWATYAFQEEDYHEYSQFQAPLLHVSGHTSKCSAEAWAKLAPPAADPVPAPAEAKKEV